MQRVGCPTRAELSREGQGLQEDFKRRLVAPYQEVDFWHEAIKRLAVVRQRMSRPIWERLMSDLLRCHPARRPPRPPGRRCARRPGSGPAPGAGTSPCTTRWPRSSPSGSCRCMIATRAGARGCGSGPPLIYREITEGQGGRGDGASKRVVDRPETRARRTRRARDHRGLPPSIRPAARPRGRISAEPAALIAEVVHLDERSHEIDQLRVNAFHYQLLCGFRGRRPTSSSGSSPGRSRTMTSFFKTAWRWRCSGFCPARITSTR